MPPKRCAVVASAWLNSSNSFACCSGVKPIPVSATATSIQSPPSAHPSRPQLDLALFGELAGIAQQIEQDLPQPHGIDGQGTEIVRGLDYEAVLVLLGELPRGADDFVDKGYQFDGRAD